jgi:hypothetical protein
MSVDKLRGRFVVKHEDKYNPVAIISNSNTFCGYGNNIHECRNFWSLTEICSLTDGKAYVDMDIAEACINEIHQKLCDDRTGRISDSYKNFPKTKRGFKQGFFRKEVDKKIYDLYEPDRAYSFEKYVLPRI